MTVQQLTVTVDEPKVLTVSVEADGEVMVSVAGQSIFARRDLAVQVTFQPVKKGAGDPVETSTGWTGVGTSTGEGGLAGRGGLHGLTDDDNDDNDDDDSVDPGGFSGGRGGFAAPSPP